MKVNDATQGRERCVIGAFSVITLSLMITGLESMRERTHPNNVRLVEALDRALEEAKNVLPENNLLAQPIAAGS